MHLNYENRVGSIARALNDFLRQFKTPEHLDSETALKRIRLTADAINKRLPASLNASDLDARLGDLFVSVMERHKTREWPMPEAFLAHLQVERPHFDGTGEVGNAAHGDRSALSASDLATLENKILPTARRWLGTSMHEHGQKTLEFWGEAAE